jgi:hypothetical protein
VAGVEDSASDAQVIVDQGDCGIDYRRWTQIWTQISGKDRQSLARLVESWPELPAHFKAAIDSIVDASEGGAE